MQELHLLNINLDLLSSVIYQAIRVTSFSEHEKLFQGLNPHYTTIEKALTNYLFFDLFVSNILFHTDNLKFITMFENSGEMILYIHIKQVYRYQSIRDFILTWVIQSTITQRKMLLRISDFNILLYSKKCKTGSHLECLYQLLFYRKMLVLAFFYLNKTTRPQNRFPLEIILSSYIPNILSRLLRVAQAFLGSRPFRVRKAFLLPLYPAHDVKWWSILTKRLTNRSLLLVKTPYNRKKSGSILKVYKKWLVLKK